MDDKFHATTGWVESLPEIYEESARKTNLWWRIVWAATVLAVATVAFHLIWGLM